jgi:hypothetical protein
MCCTLVPVDLREGHKPSGVRCQHLRSKGCGIYATRPVPCQAWSCKWLFDPETAALRRPDHAGYCIDPTPDTVLADGRAQDVIQIWCDPKRPDAHRDPALRDWLALMWDRFHMLAIVRWNSRDGFVIVPPGASADGDWFEVGGELKSEEDMLARLAEVGAMSLLDSLVPPERRGMSMGRKEA